MLDIIEIQNLSNLIIGEIFIALGLKKYGFFYRTFKWIFQKPATQLATISSTADSMIATDGFSKAAEWMLGNWCDRVTSRGTDTIPRSGPLIILSNHAGTYDTFVITSEAKRDDLKIITSDVPFLKNLPHARQHTIFLSEKIGDRTAAARSGMKHLQEGGALLLYGTGLIDPDPAVYSGAETWIDKWLPSIDLFLRIAPKASVVLSIVSGVVSERWAHHPITWLNRIDWKKRRLAEFGQVINQLISPGSFFLQPSISFAPPLKKEQLLLESDGKVVLPAIKNHGKALLKNHISWISKNNG